MMTIAADGNNAYNAFSKDTDMSHSLLHLVILNKHLNIVFFLKVKNKLSAQCAVLTST